MEQRLEEWASRVAGWARTRQEIGEVWFFGSRVKGEFCEASDLDVALVMRDRQRPKGERYGDWLFLSEGWKAELEQLLPVRIDLQVGDDDIAINVVAPAVHEHGIKVYSAGE
jgi:predicted nucleotidyltransferase